MNDLIDKRLVVIAGKGGVGRTTVAASLALAAARRGKRVLLAQLKSKERLSTLFGCPPVGPDLVRVRENLTAVNIFPDSALREYGLMVLRWNVVYKAVFENRLARSFIRAIPGVDDYSLLGKVWFHSTEEEHGRRRFDLIIVDGPATGHIVTLLQIPQSIIEAVPDGPLTRDARSARELLTDPRRTSALLVTLAEEMPVNETLELAASLRSRVGIHLGGLVINQLYPPRFVSGPSARALAALPQLCNDEKIDPLLVRSRIAAGRRAMNDEYVARLESELTLPQAQLPYLFSPRFGADETEELSRRLEGQLAQLGSAA